MKLARRFILPRRKAIAGDAEARVGALEEHVDTCMGLIEKFLNDARAATNANESTVLLATVLPKPGRQYRGLFVQIIKAPAAQDELWLGVDGAGGDTFIQVA